jgi:MYXO-CTERM domain-containing protein
VPTPRITVYEDLGHNVWTQTIEPEIGLGAPVLDSLFTQGTNVDLDPYDVDLYTWLLQHDKPVVDAGADVEATTDDALVQLQATTVDDDPIVYAWTQTSGAALTLANADTDTLDVSGLAVGVYTFEVLAIDADDQHDVDEVALTVVDAPIEGTTTGGVGETTTTEPSTAGEEATSSEEAGTSITAGSASAEGSATTPGGSTDTASGSASGSGSGSASAGSSSGVGPGSGGATGDADTDTLASVTGEEAPGCSCSTRKNDTAPALFLLMALAAVRRRNRRAPDVSSPPRIA